MLIDSEARGYLLQAWKHFVISLRLRQQIWDKCSKLMEFSEKSDFFWDNIGYSIETFFLFNIYIFNLAVSNRLVISYSKTFPGMIFHSK